VLIQIEVAEAESVAMLLMREIKGFVEWGGVIVVIMMSLCGWGATPAMTSGWGQAVAAARVSLNRGQVNSAEQAWTELDRSFPVESDWILQDLGARRNAWLGSKSDGTLARDLLKSPLEECGRAIQPDLRHRAESLISENPAIDDPRWLTVYAELCEQRRGMRLKTVLETVPRLVFTKHYNLGGSHYAYTEGLSDAQRERHFVPGSELCLLQFEGTRGRVTTLLADPKGVIRDPAVSWDGRRILFSWKKDDRQDDYHLYEMQVATRTVRQLTFGLGVADYEGAYLPNGDIVFNSTRCIQTVDCWWTEVSNLYACDKDGRALRRLSFDQVHVNYPQVLDDGRVIYTRWEYNDRGQIYVQGLFQMMPDGTGQTEFYGNNSWFPTSLLHARGIPGTRKVVAIASGHHSGQMGKLCVVDPDQGRQENEGVTLIAPVRDTPAVKVDVYGQDAPLWMTPWALNEREFLVSFSPLKEPCKKAGRGGRFSLYTMDETGRRELLASAPDESCSQPVPLIVRSVPHVRPSLVDYRMTNGTYYMQNVYEGPGLKGIPKGAAKALRVVALEYRVAGIGHNGNGGEAGGALVSTPISIGNGCWDPKRVLGTTPILEDGSAMFTVSARTPVYFQVLDASNQVIQTMRSWSVLQPSETFACVGCHENKNTAPPSGLYKTLAFVKGPQPLTLDSDLAGGFSFLRHIQPILDGQCIKCHDGGKTVRGGRIPSMTSSPVNDPVAKRVWTASYVALTGVATQGDALKFPLRGKPGSLVNWVQAQSAPPMLAPYSCGAARSGLMSMLRKGHGGAKLTAEQLDRIACWIDLGVPFCGNYLEAKAWSDAEKALYDKFFAKRQAMEAAEAIQIKALIDEPR
jgi:hypothetical protein